MHNTHPTSDLQGAFCPPPPGSTVIQRLRWLVAVLDEKDGSLAFAASVLAYALRHQGDLTDRQRRAIDRISDRILDGGR
jgi:hypothetical protein